MARHYPGWVAILIDPPLWPAHGTLWSHLVSDTSYEELHAFAAQIPLPRRGFDLDHYDVPAHLHDRAVALGAIAVGSRDVVHRLRRSGLRVKQVERSALRPIRRRQYLVAEWANLADAVEIDGADRARDAWGALGADLIDRWNEPHRSYHDEQHLEDVLLALNHLGTRGEELSAATLMAAWFHDAIYTGRGPDERDSAALAVRSLGDVGVAPAFAQHVAELIAATEPAIEIREATAPLAHLLDADLSIFAANDARYHRYTDAVRSEYAHVPDDQFRAGRSAILEAYLGHPTIYRTTSARDLWEERARVNLHAEISRLRQ